MENGQKATDTSSAGTISLCSEEILSYKARPNHSLNGISITEFLKLCDQALIAIKQEQRVNKLMLTVEKYTDLARNALNRAEKAEAERDAAVTHAESLRKMLHSLEPLRGAELDYTGAQFAYRFTDGCSNGCVEIYSEDDDWWHHVYTFDRLWLQDLKATVDAAIKAEGERHD